MNDSDKLKYILQNYWLWNLINFHLIDFTIDNQNFLVETGKWRIFLKIFSSKDIGYIEFHNNVLSYLKKNWLKVPWVILYKDSTVFGSEFGLVSIYEFMHWTHLEEMSVDLTNDLWKNIWLIHQYLLNYKSWIKKYQRCYSKKNLWNCDTTKLRKSLVHWDLWNLNILVDDDKTISWIIDFGDIHYDYLVSDIWTIFADIFMQEKRSNFIKIFMEGYKSYICLNQTELDSIYYFIEQRLKWALHRINEKLQIEKNPDKIFHLKKNIKNTNIKLIYLYDLWINGLKKLL